ncbi:hypothetical protein [Flavobacterium sp. I3-2]|uniref:hypothetical protein n=1 Tax=Flavobacterium sp. I3-2 TaxID=2748319 RepID=UPI0015B1AD3E|nr:hypothetical protein [Flavobacterium sp. I3-2]
MKSVYLIAMFALSFGASAQQRSVYQEGQSPKYQHERREVGRQQRLDPYKQKYDSKDFDYRGLDLSRSQKLELDDLMFRMHQDIKIAQRNYRRPEFQIRKIEKAYDLKISKVLSKYQYDKFMKMYAYQYPGFGYGSV